MYHVLAYMDPHMIGDVYIIYVNIYHRPAPLCIVSVKQLAQLRFKLEDEEVVMSCLKILHW